MDFADQFGFVHLASPQLEAFCHAQFDAPREKLIRYNSILDPCGTVAEWSNAPDSKSGVQFLLYRGFESLLFRQ
jgi:hypothetical protein